jgi:hypothetical protein
LTAGDGAQGDTFGDVVALSADATTALIAAPARNSDTGAVYVFRCDGATWSQQAELTASDGAAGHRFGVSVALSADGSIALIGAYDKNNQTGAAYVFVRSGTTWSQHAELTAGDGGASDRFGDTLALSADGSIALIGAVGESSSGNLSKRIPNGAAYVFGRNGTSWSQQAELTASDGAPGDEFGEVALSADGGTALIGAILHNNGTGAAYVFVGNGPSWSQQAELTASDGASGADFGDSVALSADGSTALIYAPIRTRSSGAAYVFVRSGTTWSQQAELSTSDMEPGYDASVGDVALSADGNTALVAARYTNNAAGADYVFARNGTTWSQQQVLTASDGAPKRRVRQRGALRRREHRAHRSLWHEWIHADS